MTRAKIAALYLLVMQLFGSPARAQNLLENAGFETGDRSSWFANWLPDQAGALATTTASHSGNFGLWIYSAAGFGGDSYSELSQAFVAQPGEVFTGGAYIRTPGAGWASGSFACVRLLLVTETGWIMYESPHLTTAETPYADPFVITTPPAPLGTRLIYFYIHVHKPAGIEGQAVANFDDCTLERIVDCGDCIGDIDLDGQVALADLATLLAHFGTSSSATCQDGDVSPAGGDGAVDLADLAALLAGFGTTCP